MEDSLEVVLARCEALVEVLKFYASPENWREQETGIGMYPSEADLDCGYKARAILEELNQ